MSPSTASTASLTAAPARSKPIRFVTNHDGPYAKRRRINSACSTCRRKKTRCSGERPVCGTCKQNKHECEGNGADIASTDTGGNHLARKEDKNVHSQPKSAIFMTTSYQSKSPLSRDTRAQDSLAEPPGNKEPPFVAQTTNPPYGSLQTLGTRDRMPYFRYFGPTAIMPGFKQMVVKIRDGHSGTGPSSSEAADSTSNQAPSASSPTTTEPRTPINIPVYDASTVSPSSLITHLCTIFFTYLGCNFPFLQRDRFMRDLEEKQVEAILVDAVCALAARFSCHSIFTGHAKSPKEVKPPVKPVQPSEYGQAFARRARSAMPDAMQCPSVAVVQAALLIGFDEFGASRDSGLWMYLGIAIRMAQDLGMQTLQGLRFEGRQGPAPKSIRAGLVDDAVLEHSYPQICPQDVLESVEEDQRAVERERVDTFWAIFLLDRVISSGTGRTVTLRDEDIELSFPPTDNVDDGSHWPLPWPALIRIVHLYGRVTDLLNSIKDESDITLETRQQLDRLEHYLTQIYQNLSPRLHFNAVNFQHYAKLHQGPNFLLLHCWFHTLIVLLHQPALLKTFALDAQTISHNGRELAMSSAKTIADILAFTELIDAKTSQAIPFASQPIYIAACAFLQEASLHAASSGSSTRTPSPSGLHRSVKRSATSLDHMSFEDPIGNINAPSTASAPFRNFKQAAAAKQSLLATAANQNYQRCYRAFKAIEPYWAGVGYILTVLDQKATGVVDPLLYTREECDNALEAPRPEPSFTSPGWRRKLSSGTYLTAQDNDVNAAKVSAALRRGIKTPLPGSPMNPNQAIGWSLTGTMNSPSTNVAVVYTSEHKPSQAKATTTQTAHTLLSSDGTTGESTGRVTQVLTTTAYYPTAPMSKANISSLPERDSVMMSDADLLLNLHSPIASNSPAALGAPQRPSPYTRTPAPVLLPETDFPNQMQGDLPAMIPYSMATDSLFGDMVIDSQDVDMSVFGADLMMPWDLEYLPQDMLYGGDTSYDLSNISNDVLK